MAKSRRKKNYKLRRRVMRTVAALTMIMAIVVAAIPVENYGTMRAADGGWEYDADTSEDIRFTAFDESSYNNAVLTTQTLTDDTLSDSVDVKGDSSLNGAHAIISRYTGTETVLDISGKMYYDYAYFTASSVEEWAREIQSGSESFKVTFRLENDTTRVESPVENSTDFFTIPAKFNMTNPQFVADFRIQGNSIAGFITNTNSSFTYDYIKGVFDKFQNFENDVIIPYNNAIQGFIDRSRTVTETSWNELKDDVEEFIDANSNITTECEQVIDTSITFEAYSDNFWVKNFAERVTYNVMSKEDNPVVTARIPLRGFELSRVNKRSSGEPDQYVYVAQLPNDVQPGREVEPYIDDNGYLADGYVYIDGIAANAFNRYASGQENSSTIRTITLPDTIKGIGDSAFENSGLTSITLNTKVCTQIGNRAFYGCGISEINLTNADGDGISLIEKIGKEAFYGTNISDITFPSSLRILGEGSFAETPLTEIVFQQISGDLTIDKHAFYNCSALTNVTLPQGITSNQTVDIKEAAFSMANDRSDDGMQAFSFPDNMKSWDESNDYILAGRKNLQSVTFPSNMSGEIPANTFAGCTGLAVVTLGKISHNDRDGQNIKVPSELFKDVSNDSFYVEGPAIIVGGDEDDERDKSTGRKDTLECKVRNGKYVPYMFYNSEGRPRIEQKQGDGNITAEIEVINGDEHTAQLTRYTGTETTVLVDDNVAGYRVISLGAGCFDPIKRTLKELIIKDNSLIEIGNEALKDASALERVTIGNSVEFIGTDAFANCSSLEDVYFNEPLVNGDDWSQVLTITPGAFRTNSDKLTFHGVVQGGYGPFEYAMGASTAGFTSRTAGKNICYQSLVALPAELRDEINDSTITDDERADANKNVDDLQKWAGIKIIRDNDTGLSTLVDYPHLENMDPDVQQALRDYIDAGAAGSATLNEEQARLLNAVLNIAIPEGVQSIDSKTFFSSSRNAENKDYITEKVHGEALFTLYSEDKIEGDEDNIGGLFSGYFYEFGQGLITVIASRILGDDAALAAVMPRDGQLNLKQDAYTENEYRGNDHLTSIVLSNTITEMPEQFAFDSCENLISVTLGGGIKEIGALPFRGCKSLETVIGNGYYVSENGILYGKTNPDSEDGVFDQIVECLETRGGTTSRVVRVSNDPNLANVTNISEGAFSNCLLLNDVDLRGTKITQIPKDCFKGSSRIQEIILPETVTSVQEGAFVTGKNARDGAIDIWVYDPNCDIDANALGNESQYTIHAYEYTDNTNTRHTYVYNFCQTHSSNVEFEAIEPGWTVRFRDTRDGSIIKSVTGISTGAEIVPPDMDEYLAEHPYEGHEFDRWLWTDADGEAHYGRETYNDIREDRDVYAQYKIASDDYVFTGEEVTVNIVGGTVNGNGTINADRTSIRIPSGNDIFITADEPTNQTFRNWSVSDSLDRWLNDTFSTQTTFKVPNPPESGTITITANFITTSNGDGSNTPNPDGTYTVTVNNGTGSGNFRPGATVTITANAAQTGQTFTNWTTTTAGVNFANANTATTTFVMPSSNVVVTANYSGGTTNPGGTYTVTVNNGTGSGQFAQGATVTIVANTPNAGASFVNWTTATAGVTFASATSSTTTFTMPASNVTVTANFSDGTGGQPSGGNSTTTKYKVTVNYGSGSGEYAAGATVSITANAPESSSRVFSRWTTANSGLGFANANAVSTTFVMPAADVTVTANYKTRTSDDDDDDDSSPSRRPGTNTSTTTVDNRPSSSTSTTTSTTGTVSNPTSGTSTTNNNNGNRIYITKNGISNTDVASLAVNGSTDNFIVRITESPEATAAVEQALTNTYGSLNGLAYLPMDISLYDSTGQNKITDTTGLNITVTIPIPDVLIQYGGNARVAAADNGTLQQITPRFTTIDGIACVSFVPPHFSPYVIYVDTNNLIAGQMYDATPATGDPIHPKWFAAIGMACVSILLFVMSDGRKRKKYRAA